MPKGKSVVLVELDELKLPFSVGLKIVTLPGNDNGQDSLDHKHSPSCYERIAIGGVGVFSTLF